MNIAGETAEVALSLRDRKAELSNSVDEAFGCPVAERQGYSFLRMKTTSSKHLRP
jgi:hypothetical protein